MLIPFALHVLSSESTGIRKLQPNKIYYLLKGFKIENDIIYIDSYRLKKEFLYQDYFLSPDSPDISISALVGGNGSGKSSIIEFFMRLINNFAASTIGEYEVNPGAQHLHYINGVEGEFFYLLNNIPYRLKIKNRHVLLEKFDSIYQEKKQMTYKYIKGDVIYDNKLTEEKKEKDIDYFPMNKMTYSNNKSMSKEKTDSLKDLYHHIFYSYISNYSIYAYNTHDFFNECNTDAYEGLIRNEKNKKYDYEYRNWLNGIFHKNDGYQTPIVLTPFRTKGNININIENELSKERLLVLLISPESKYRKINGHLITKGLELMPLKPYDFKLFKQKVGLIRLQTRGYQHLCTIIINLWGKYINVDLTSYKNTRLYYDEATNYLVYKTLKISQKYSQYHFFYKAHSNIAYKIDDIMLDKLVEMLSIDYSHITKKIRQVLSYIIYDTYPFYSKTKSKSFDIDSISIRAKSILKENEQILKNNKLMVKLAIDDLVPPPIFDVKIQLEDNINNQSVLFETLSSGERQQVYSISALLYHLTNLESVWQDSNYCRISYEHINVILEEIELYFHPELQRTYIMNIFDGIKQLKIPHIKSINICFVTHSPFILSDIANQNILALNSDKEEFTNEFEGKRLSTFGANIHDILKNSFFLKNGSMGAYADHVIRDIIKKMDKAKKNKDKSCSTNIHKKILLIDEPIVRKVLLDEYHRVFTQENVQEKIKELETQIKELEKRL